MSNNRCQILRFNLTTSIQLQIARGAYIYIYFPTNSLPFFFWDRLCSVRNKIPVRLVPFILVLPYQASLTEVITDTHRPVWRVRTIALHWFLSAVVLGKSQCGCTLSCLLSNGVPCRTDLNLDRNQVYWRVVVRWLKLRLTVELTDSLRRIWDALGGRVWKGICGGRSCSVAFGSCCPWA